MLPPSALSAFPFFVISEFHLSLARWYGAARRDLPWRETRDPYRIWVSETMLVQTQAATVVGYYLRFIRRFPDVPSLASADLQDVLKLWEGLGYYSRARHFHQAAVIVADRHGGVVPANPEALRALPGVGDYIAAAVSSIAFGHPAAAVDGNVKRVLARLLAVDAPVNAPSSHSVFKPLAEGLLDVADPGGFNQAMMELGALICRPAGPCCGDCPVRSWCRAWALGKVAAFPVTIRKPPVPHHHLAVAAVVKQGKALIVRRPETGLLGGLWEFPGGILLADESPDEACRRIIRETTGMEARVRFFLTQVQHAYTHFKITAQVFVCDWESGRPRLNGHVEHLWVGMEELDRYPFPKSNHKFMKPLKACLADPSQAR